jgi:TRAP-type mannitol/chloroaromatic compound transport system permease small subunit
MTVHERIYRSLLVVYPPRHRREYGEPMAQLLRDRLRDEGGGMRTVVVWVEVASDLVRTALSERTETTMEWFKTGWWLIAAALIAVALALLGIGNLQGDDGGPLYGKIVAAVIAVGAALLVFAGLGVRRRHRALGSLMIGVGVLPAGLLVVFFWFPPVALIGVLSLGVAITAFVDVERSRRRTEAAA